MDSKRSLFFHFSNDLEYLFEKLSDKIRCTRPFSKQYIVVPSHELASCLKIRLADRLGLCMGVEFLPMQAVIHRLITHFFPKFKMDGHVPLALKIQNEILKHMDEKELEPLISYLKGGDGKRLDTPKLTALSDHLASLFVTYSLYRNEQEEIWEAKLSTHWQKKIWDHIFTENNYYKNPYAILADPIENKETRISIFLFHLNFIPGPYFKLFEYLSSYLPIEFFQFSPCCMYWADVQNPTEQSYSLAKFSQSKIKREQINEMEEYLADSNSFLASFGKLGRIWQKQIESCDFQLDECYRVSEEALNYKEYEPLVGGQELEFVNRPLTLLRALQTDILLMRSKAEKVILPIDKSIQIHQASNYEREVEVLYDSLLGLFDQNKDLLPSDIAVYVAHMGHYVPHIENIFRDSKLEIFIHHYSFAVNNQVLKAVFDLLEFHESRVDEQKLLELFCHPAFAKRFNLTSETLYSWRQWVEELGPFWGYDSLHQESHLHNNYNQETQKPSALGSWQEFIDKLLHYLCINHSKQSLLPYASTVSFSQAEEINQFVELLYSLKSDLEILSKEKKSLSQWAKYVRCLIESYFLFEEESAAQLQKIGDSLRSFEMNYREFEEEVYDFSTFYYYLKKEWVDAFVKNSQTQLEVIQFYSLFEAAAMPAKYSFILGLNEVDFPRPYKEHPLSLVKQLMKRSEFPIVTDYDRYLFLEILLCSSHGVYLSYLGYNPKNLKPASPSIVITELCNYLNAHFSFNNLEIIPQILFNDPVLPFNSECFAKKNYHLKHYPLAQSFYQVDKNEEASPSDHFFQFESLATQLSLLKTKSIAVEELFLLARNPLQFNLNKTHQIFLERKKTAHAYQNFVLSPMQRAILKKAKLKNENWPNSAQLPIGFFKELANSMLMDDMDGMEGFLSENKLSVQDIFSVEFREDIAQPFQFNKNLWLVPSPQIALTPTLTVTLSGLLEGVSTKGLLSMGLMSKETIWGELPQYLLYTHLHQILPFEMEKSWLFAKSKKVKHLAIDQPLSLLKNYLHLYHLNQSYTLPFLPCWVESFLEDSSEDVIEKVNKDINSLYFFNEYAKVLMHKNSLKIPHIEPLKKLAHELFNEAYLLLKDEVI